MVLRKVKNLYHRYVPYRTREVDNYFGRSILNQHEGNAFIYQGLCSGEPFLAARIGTSELGIIMDYDAMNINSGHTWSERHKVGIQREAGVFPGTDEVFRGFSKLFIEQLANVDFLGVWFNEQEDLACAKFTPQATLGRLRSIEPFYHANPWSAYLAGKKVLVVHPFKESILKQIAKKDLLFDNPEVLPDFSLEIIQAVQTMVGTKSRFSNWFEAYEYMCEEIEKSDFDIAILGCGAYGLPLAGFVKSLGKQAIHMGGATQILFGIKGGRWDKHPVISHLYNKHWIRPTKNERPKNYLRFENGSNAYW